jgi:small subunit ribosomal protein S11
MAKATGGAKAALKGKKKVKKNVPKGVCHIQATFNNTIVTIADLQGNTISWSSSGSRGFKGSRKSTPFAAQVAAEDAARKADRARDARDRGVHQGSWFRAASRALRALTAAGFRVTLIRDVTPVPHNGCRPPKRRRV